MNPDARSLDLVFGPGDGTTAEARARASKTLFVRGLDQLSEDDRPGAGRRLTAREALDAYGFDKLLEVATEGSALLASSADAAGLPLSTRRNQLGLEARVVAERARVSVDEVRACEASRRLPLRTYEKVGRALGLDERYVAVKRQPTGNDRVTVRLRSIGEDAGALGSFAVVALAEAAWVAATQARLAAALGLGLVRHGLEPSVNFGSPSFPAFKWGYRQAREVREALGMGVDAPIPSVRELVEETFGVTLVQCDLGEAIAGATIEAGGNRAIVVNLSGRNRSVYMRRTTMAHELGHLLFDPPGELNALRVDDYENLGLEREQLADRVEQRANAFAVELLAPQEAILAFFEREKDLTSTVGHFGLGPTPARHQIRNASNGAVRADALRVARPESEEWRKYASFDGAESMAVEDFHPIPGIRSSRAGRFGAFVVRAAEDGIVSWDTAAEWLETSEEEARKAAAGIHELFPSVWR